jgi:ribosomal protein S13
VRLKNVGPAGDGWNERELHEHERELLSSAPMGSDLYAVTVVRRKEARVELRLAIIHPDVSIIPENEGFALQLLLSPDLGQQTSIAREVTFDEAHSAAWMKKNVRAYVTDVKLKAVRGRSGTLEIGVSHPAWIDHLALRREFTSRAFTNALPYAPCAPRGPLVRLLGVDLPRGERLDRALTRLPGVDRAAALEILASARVDASSREALTKAQVTKLGKLLEARQAARGEAGGAEGFLQAPSALWSLWTDDARECPEVVSIPAYAPNAYVVVEEASAKDRKRLRGWLGQTVRRGDKIGALWFDEKNEPALLSYWRSRGQVNWSVGTGLGSLPVGRLAFRPAGRPKVALTKKDLPRLARKR